MDVRNWNALYRKEAFFPQVTLSWSSEFASFQTTIKSLPFGLRAYKFTPLFISYLPVSFFCGDS